MERESIGRTIFRPPRERAWVRCFGDSKLVCPDLSCDGNEAGAGGRTGTNVDGGFWIHKRLAELRCGISNSFLDAYGDSVDPLLCQTPKHVSFKEHRPQGKNIYG